MKFENTRVYNFEGALRGMRNPMNSWDKSDSYFGLMSQVCVDDTVEKVAYNWTDTWAATLDSLDDHDKETTFKNYANWLLKNGILNSEYNASECAFIGPKDMQLAQKLIKAGSEHRKFLRQIFVSVDITAPIYWQVSFCQ